MSGQEQDITQNDLLAYADGQLDGDARDRVERLLAADAAATALVREWQRQNGLLEALYGPVAREAVPERLQPKRLARLRKESDARTWRQLAAALALLALGTGSGWLGHGLLAGGRGVAEPLVAQAVEAHDLYSGDVLHPVEVKGEDSAHLQTWLSKRLDRKLSIPDLRSDGLKLVGGRLLPAAGGEPAALIMYEDDSGQRVSLYVVPTNDGGETALRYNNVDGLEAVSWTDEDVHCALIGGLPRSRLEAIAKTAYAQLI